MKGIFVVIFGIISLGLNAQRYSFISYSNQDGLPQSQVTSITQDDKGYLWVGTLGGLAKFNGKRFTSFTLENGLLNNRITCLQNEKNALWIGHEGGITLFRNNRFVKWKLPEDFSTTAVTDIVRFQGKVVVSTNGGGLFTISGTKLLSLERQLSNHRFSNQPEMSYHQEDDLRVRDMLVHKGVLYLGTRGGLLTTDDLKLFRHDHDWDIFNISGLTLTDNGLAASTYEDGLVGRKFPTSKPKPLVEIDSSMRLRGCLTDRQHAVWLYAAQGVCRMNKNQQVTYFNESNGLPIQNIRVVFEDIFGNIWLGSEGKGLLRFPGLDFTYFNQQDGMTSDLILSTAKDRDGSYWLGTYDKGALHKLKNGKFEAISFESSNTVWCTALNVDDSHWFGTSDGLVKRNLNGKLQTFYNEDGLPGNKITALYRVDDQTMYIGGENGVTLFKAGDFIRIPIQQESTVRSFSVYKGKLYCATDRGLAVLNGGKIIRVKGVNLPVFSLYADDETGLWMGNESGLYLWKDGELATVSLAQQAASSFITFITGFKNRLFVGTNNGVYIIEIAADGKRVIRHYGISDGLVNLETNLNSAMIEPSGKLWFGTASGLVSFVPSAIKSITNKPLLVLDKLWFNFQRDTTKLNRNGRIQQLVVPHSKNTITFEIDGIDLSGSGLTFQYWLEGLDQNWRPPNDNRTITFNGLPAGEYMLHVRGTNAKGVVSDELTLKITVKQAFYKTWWFIGIVLLFLGWVIWNIFRFRLKREREKAEREKLEYSSRLLTLEQKTLNASMNRHFIFNSLNSIQYYINTQDKRSANKFLTNFAKLIRKNLDSSEEGNLVSLQEEIDRLILYCSLESMRFNNRFEFNLHVDPQIDTELVILPAMLLQPFIENSIIHGVLPVEDRMCKIDVYMTIEHGVLNIQIDDDGLGVDYSKSIKKETTYTHQSQGVEISAKRVELLQKLSGKQMSIEGPFQLNGEHNKSKGTRVIVKIQL